MLPFGKVFIAKQKLQQKRDTAMKDDKKIVSINEALVQDNLNEMVRSTVEQTLNDMLDAEADQLCNASWEIPGTHLIFIDNKREK